MNPDPQMPGFVLVTVECDDPSRRYEQVEAELRAHGNPCQVMARTWVVETTHRPADLFKMLSLVFQPDDRFVVVPTAGEWLARGARTKRDCFRNV